MSDKKKNKEPVMHPSGVQYPHLLEGKLSRVEKTALKYIRLFDEAMKAQGIQTLVGIEQEMFIQPELDNTFAAIAEAKRGIYSRRFFRI